MERTARHSTLLSEAVGGSDAGQPKATPRAGGIASSARLAIAMANGRLMRGENVSRLSDNEFIARMTSSRPA